MPMPRTETIEIKIDKQDASKEIGKLQGQADKLQKTLGNIKVKTAQDFGGTQKGVDALTASVRKLQEAYDRLHVAEGKRRSSEAREAFKGYQDRVKEEEKYLKLQQKIQAEYDKIALKNKRLDNKAMVEQMGREAKEAEKHAKSVAKLQAEYDKLSSSKAKAALADKRGAFGNYLERAKEEEKALNEQKKLLAEQAKIQAEYDKMSAARAKSASAEKQDTFKGYLERAKEAEQFLKVQEKIQAQYDKESAARAKSASAGKQETFKGYLERAKEAEEFLKYQQKIQEAYDKEAASRAKQRSAGKQEAFSGYLERAKEAEQFLKLQEKIQAAYDKESASRAKAQSKESSASAKEAFKGYLERAEAATKAAAAEEKLAAAQRKMGDSWGTVNAGQATNIAAMTQYIRAQDGMENATVRATGAIRNSVGTFQTYSVSTNAAGQATQNYRVAVDTTTGQVYALDQGVRTATVSMSNMGRVALSFVKQIVGFYGAAQSIRYALKEMKSMSDEMIVYQKVTKATDLQMEQIRKQSYATAKAYGQTPTDFLSAAQEMARAGYGEQASAMADLAVKTKLVGDITAEEASKFLLAVDAGYKYGGSIEKLSHVLDMANEVGNNYATSIGKISEGMTLVASLAGQANIPIEQLIAALGTMTAATQRSGSEMARALRFITLGILGDTVSEVEEGVTVTAEEVDSLTTALQHYAPEVVEAAKASGQLINPMEAVASLAKAYKSGLIGSQEELFSISKAIAGQRYYNAFAALIENYDTLYLGMLEHEKNAAGSADAEIERLTKSWSTKFNRLKTQWVEMVNASLSEGLIKDLIEGSTAALEFAGSLENLAGAALGAYTAFKSLKAGLAGMKEAGGSISGFGAGNWFGIGAGVLIAGISAAKSAYEKSMRDAQSAAEKAVSSAIEKTSGAKDMASILARYKKIASDGIDKEKGELGELKTLQNDLNNLVGDQGKAIDIVNGKYGDTLKKLKEMTEEQRKAALIELNTAKSTAVANWKQQDLNGTFVSGLNTGVPMEYNKAIEEYLKNSKYFRVFEGADGFPMLFMNKKPEDAEGILEFYKEIEDFYNWLGSHTSTGEEAAKGMKSMGEEYSSMYVKLASFVSLVKTAAGPVKEAQDAIDNFNKAMSEEGSTSPTGSGDAGDNNKKVEKSYMTLADAIEEATKAKEKFDDAMKKTKADEANAYTKAVKTYKDELKKGRVNSTAFYASARMLLGDDAYNRTNGSSSAVRAALNKRKAGTSGSIMDAWNILSASYKNKKGVEMEGYGIYQLLSQTKGVKGLSSKTLVDKNGNIRIPKLSDKQWDQISQQWGGISKAALLNYFNSFDQYNKKGKATDEKTKTKKQLTDEQKNTKAIDGASKAVKEATAAVNGLAEKMAQEEKPGEGEGDKGGEGAGETPPPTGEGTGEPTVPEEPQTLPVIARIIEILDESDEDPNDFVSNLTATIDYWSDESGDPPEGMVEGLTAIVDSFVPGEDDPEDLVNDLTAFISTFTANATGPDSPDDTVSSLNALIAVYKNKSKTGKGDPNWLVSALTAYVNNYVNKGEPSDDLVNGLAAWISTYDGTDPNKLVSNLEAYVGAYTGNKDSADGTVAALNAFIETYEKGGDPNDTVKALTAWVTSYVNKGEPSDDLVAHLVGYVTEYHGVTQGKGSPDMLVSGLKALIGSYGNKRTSGYGDPNWLVSTLSAFITSYQSGEGKDPNDLVASLSALVVAFTPKGGKEAPNEMVSALSAFVTHFDPKDTDPDTLVAGLSALVTAFAKDPKVNPNRLVNGLLAVINKYKNGEGVDPNGLVDDLRAVVKTELDQTAKERTIAELNEIKAAAQSALEAINQATGGGSGGGDGGGSGGGNEQPTTQPDFTGGAVNGNVQYDANATFAEKMAQALSIIEGFQMPEITDESSLAQAKQLLSTIQSLAGELASFGQIREGEVVGEGFDIDASEVESAYDSLEQLGEKLEEVISTEEVKIPVGADTSGAETSIQNTKNKAAQGAVMPITLQYRGGNPVAHSATGSDNFKGGLSLVNDGAGPELIVNRGRAFIAGGGKPTVVNLDKGAKIFTATETRNILNNGGMPSFAGGTGEYSADVKPGDYKADSDKKKKSSSSKSKKKSKDKEKDESFSKLQEMVDYIINRIGKAVSEQIQVIDEQIAQLQKQRELAKQQDELAEKQKAVADAQKDLQDAMNERTVRYLGEDGKWHWQADARKVESAKEALSKANDSLAEYVDEMIYNDKVQKLEDRKTKIQGNYNNLTKQWSDIVEGVNTPTGTINKLLNDVMKNGTKQEKEGAKAVQNILLKNAKSGSFKVNYTEALNAIKAATKGNPVMPKDTATTLASLIAGAGGEKISGSLKATLTTAVAGTKNTSTKAKTISTTNNSKNYYINGVNIGKIAAETKSLSALLKDLSVYAGG